MDQQELLYSIALTKLNHLSLLSTRDLLNKAGSAAEVFAHRENIRAILPEATDRLQQVLAEANTAKVMKEAEKEMRAMEERHIGAVTLFDSDYPQRLLECPDAPIVLYRCGNINLNRPHIINIVGTRKCTEYGREICKNFVKELRQLVPDTVIVSGLAYGIDIHAHREALSCGMDTIAVVAHGMDMVYPAAHRKTAADIVHSGGALLTEYTIGTTPERMNFVHRNRIVAGISDACIVVESADKGGSLITAHLSLEYNRDVYAFPGKVYDEASKGCNSLIRKHVATLITSAEEFAVEAGWYTPKQKTKKGKSTSPLQQELFPELSNEETIIVKTLSKVEDLHTNQLAIQTGIPHSSLLAILFEMEMKGLVRSLGGSRYRLIR